VKYDYPPDLRRHRPYLVLPPDSDRLAYANIGRCGCRTMRLAVCNLRDDGRRVDTLPEWEGHEGYYRTIEGPTDSLRERARGIPIFTFIRNPYDRLMSFYVRRRATLVDGYYSTVGVGDRFPTSLRARLKRAALRSAHRLVGGTQLAGLLPEPGPGSLQEHFNEFVKRFVAVPYQELDNHILHMNLFVRDAGGLLPDFIGNLERVAEQWPVIEALAGRKMERSHVVESRPAGFERPAFTPETAKIIHEYFRTDFEMFGYDHAHPGVDESLHADTAGVVVRGYRMPAGQAEDLRREIERRNARTAEMAAAGTARPPLPERAPASPPRRRWHKGEMWNGLDEKGLPSRNALITAVDVTKDGTIYAGRYNVVYRSTDHENFEPAAEFRFDGQPGEVIHEHSRAMFVDSRGQLFMSWGSEGRIRRSTDGGRSFEPVCELGFRGQVRGITESRGGVLFAGGYGKNHSARLYRSADGARWDVIREWQARHIHDVRVNPHNDWLYVVVGESEGRMTEDSHALFRSKDGGATFARLVKAEPRGGGASPRPLFLPINFLGDTVILATDHFDGDNYIARFQDTGEDRGHAIERVYTLDDPYSSTDLPRDRRQVLFFCFLEWFDGTLFAGARGSERSYLLRSEDTVHWEIEETGRKWSFVAASRRHDGNCMVIARTPTALVLRKTGT